MPGRFLPRHENWPLVRARRISQDRPDLKSCGTCREDLRPGCWAYYLTAYIEKAAFCCGRCARIAHLASKGLFYRMAHPEEIMDVQAALGLPQTPEEEVRLALGIGKGEQDEEDAGPVPL